MSTSALFAARKDGILKEIKEFKNGWRSAPFVWDALCGRLLHRLSGLLPSERWESLWALAARDPGLLRPWELSTLRSTYDSVVVKREDFPQLARDFRAFVNRYRKQGQVSHYGAYADLLDRFHKEGEYQYCGWWHTSVSDNPWAVRQDDEDDYRPYNLLIDKGHQFLQMPEGDR